MDALWAIVILFALLGLGVPVPWSFAAVVAYLATIFDINLNTLMLQGFRSLNSTILLALPMYILAGYLMQSGGIAKRLVAFIESLVQKRKGGLGASMVITSGIFGAIAGTATAAVASIGTIMIGPLEAKGYPRGYSSALLGISSLLGILIPPSITMILFAVVTQQSVAACFAASIVPGIILMVFLVIYNRFSVGRAFNEKESSVYYQSEETSKFSTFISAVPALTLPFIILGGIYGGIFTPTEAAAVAVFVALIVGFFIYRDLDWKGLKSSLSNTAMTTGSIIIILIFSFIASRIMVFERIPQDITGYVESISSNPIIVLLMVNLLLVIVGMFLDDVSVTVVIAPIFLPLIHSVGVSPLQYAAIVACSVVIGANSPPVSPILYMACKIGDVSVHKAVGTAVRLMIIVALPVMLLTTFVPAFSLFLPRLMGLVGG